MSQVIFNSVIATNSQGLSTTNVSHSTRRFANAQSNLHKNVSTTCALRLKLQTRNFMKGNRLVSSPPRFSSYKPASSNKSVVMEQAAEISDDLKAIGKEVNGLLKGSSVFLVGMMGSGKSSMGRVLSSALQYACFDTDNVVEQLTRRPVPEIFKEEGEEYFRELEQQVVMELCAYTNVVVSTGGGVALDRVNWSHMQNGVVVFLDVPASSLAARMTEDGTAVTRPLLASAAGDQEALSALLKEMLGERREMYEQADVAVQLASVDDLESGAVKLLEALKDRLQEDDQQSKLRTVPKEGDVEIEGTL